MEKMAQTDKKKYYVGCPKCGHEFIVSKSEFEHFCFRCGTEWTQVPEREIDDIQKETC